MMRATHSVALFAVGVVLGSWAGPDAVVWAVAAWLLIALLWLGTGVGQLCERLVRALLDKADREQQWRHVRERDVLVPLGRSLRAHRHHRDRHLHVLRREGDSDEK